MRDYDKHLEATYGPDLDGEAGDFDTQFSEEYPLTAELADDADYDDGMYYCGDSWCDGHALPSGRCSNNDHP